MARRIKAARSASAEGVKPFASKGASTKLSIGLRTQDLFFTSGVTGSLTAWYDQSLDLVAVGLCASAAATESAGVTTTCPGGNAGAVALAAVVWPSVAA